ncbi:MAG TPA: SMC-Scp complex subunit ScpB [Candidatus Omnitrophota bacterium]|nr:SMC-Scp complex subunit ScpB [Candidatus Omnitrophota bacterium]
MSKADAVKEKEKEQKLKALRRELDEQITEQLEAAAVSEQLDTERLNSVDTQQLSEADLEDPTRAKQVIEALIFASSKPITPAEIRKVAKSLTPAVIKDYVAAIQAEYVATNRPFDLVEVAGGYEIATKKEFAPWIFKIELQKKVKQASHSALETLAILAYKQPLTRAEIEELRGVDTSGVMSTLMEKDFVKIVGKKEVPGRPFLYGTTDKFLEHFGLKDLTDLPNIDEIRDLVSKSVKKDELLSTARVVSASEPSAQPAEGDLLVSEDPVKAIDHEAEKREREKMLAEITDEIESVSTKVDFQTEAPSAEAAPPQDEKAQ